MTSHSLAFCIRNASIFSKRLGALRKSMGKGIEMVFVNGPIVLLPVDFIGTSSLAALGASEANTTSSDPLTTPQAWWKFNLERTIAHGLEESILLLKDILQRDQYDGVFGFSQGAAMTALLTALLEQPHSYPPFLIDGEAPHPPFKFCAAISGFKAPRSLSAETFGTSYSTPTLHVLRRTDVIVVEERSKAHSTNRRKLQQGSRVGHGAHFGPPRAYAL
ncbi:serine hydrolase FSH [Suillus subluteus]|nr:serine hydrolase FSH [Suillus subluteus]